MIPNQLTYKKASSLDEAFSLLKEHGDDLTGSCAILHTCLLQSFPPAQVDHRVPGDLQFYTAELPIFAVGCTVARFGIA